MNKKGQEGALIVLGIIVIIIIVAGLLIGGPMYKVWSKGKNGEAQLREAEWNRQIAVAEAEAEKQSAGLKAEADIIRARGIAESNRIISSSLTKDYITWKWVEGLHDGSSEVIYVPTEANLPILEARDN